MKNRQFTLPSTPRWAGIVALLAILAPTTVFATQFELARLAQQIELISGQLAIDLRHDRHYGSVRLRAVTLRREAAQLSDSLRRNRSNSRIRSRFKDVRRSYERLEQAFFIADRRDHDPRVYREINLLSNVFINLSDEYYYAGNAGQRSGSFYDGPYTGITIIGSRNYGPRNYGSRNYGSRNYNNRNSKNPQANNRARNSRAGGRIEPNRERAVPPVFRGNSAAVNNGRRNGSVGPSRGSRSVRSAPPTAHRSNVLERQARQDRSRRELESQARRNRNSVTTRQNTGGTNVQRGRGRAVETRRRNHFE